MDTTVPAGAESTDDAHGSTYLPLAEIRPGTTIDRYRVLERIGQGGMGVVYAAIDPDLERKVALKVVREVDQPGAGHRRERLLREARAMARLDHPNVVRAFEAGTARIGDREHVFVAMELVDGAPLGRWAESRPWRERLRALIAAGRGLAAAHAAGLVHRDVKPDNLLVDASGRARIGDFGLAAAPGEALSASAEGAGETLTQTGAILGTPAYMAPEQHRGEPADARADQFGFCVTAWQVVYGEHPFGFDDLRAAVLAGRVRPVPRGDLPRWLEPLLRRGLDVDPARRHPSVAALIDSIERRMRPPRWWIAPAVLAAAAAVALPLWVARAGDPGPTCPSATSRLRGVWDAPSRASLAARPGADSVVGVIDRRVARWQELHNAACAAKQGGEAAADLRLACTEHRLVELDALIDTLLRDDETALRRGADLVSSLPEQGLCADPKRLILEAPEPDDPAERAELAAARQDVSLASAFSAVGRTEDTEKTLARIATGASPVIDADVAYIRGGLAEVREDAAASEAEYRKAIAAAAASRYVWREVLAMLDLVRQLDEQRRPTSEVDGWLSLAEGRIRGIGGDGDLEAHLLGRRSQIQRSRGDVEAALDTARAAVALRKRVSDPDDVDTMQASHELGAALISAGYPAEAKTVLGEALDRAAATMPPDHWMIRALGDALAVAELRVGEFEGGAARLRGLIDVSVALFGEEHEEVAELRMKLVAALAMAGRPAEALPLLESVLASARRRFGEDSEDVGGLQINRAIMLSMLGRHAEAIPAGTEAVATLERALGEEHPQLIAPLTSLAGFLRESGDLRGAEAPVRRALAIAAKSLPDDSAAAGVPHAELARILALRGEHRDARRHAQRAIALLGEGRGNPAIHADAHVTLAMALDGAGDRAGARVTIEKALELMAPLGGAVTTERAHAEALRRRIIIE